MASWDAPRLLSWTLARIEVAGEVCDYLGERTQAARTAAHHLAAAVQALRELTRHYPAEWAMTYEHEYGAVIAEVGESFGCGCE